MAFRSNTGALRKYWEPTCQCELPTLPNTKVNFTKLRKSQTTPDLPTFVSINHGGHKPGKHGKHGKLRKFEKLFEYQGKLKEIFLRKTWKTQGKCVICGIIPNDNVFQRVFLSSCSGEKFENVLEISGKTQRIWFLRNVATMLTLTYLGF